MKKKYTWLTLIIIGVIGRLINHFFQENLLAGFIGIIGFIYIIVGIIYFFVFLFHKNKEVDIDTSNPKKKIGSPCFVLILVTIFLFVALVILLPQVKWLNYM